VERELSRLRQLGRCEPPELGDIVRGYGLTCSGARGPVQVERVLTAAVLAVTVHPDADETLRLDVEARLFSQLALECVEWVLALVHEAAGQVPPALVRRAGAARKQESSGVVGDERARTDARVCVLDVATRRALDLGAAVDGLDPCSADGAIPPRVQAHVGQDRAMHEQPEPTEREQEQVPERQQDEDAMRGPGHESPPEITPDPPATDA
jgi:hypothetical protein